MEQLKQTLLKQINDSQPYRYDLSELACLLHKTSTSDFVLMNKALNQLEDDFFIVRDHKNRYASAAKLGYVKGILSVNTKGVGFVDREETGQESLRIEPEDLNGAMHQDEVVVQIDRRLHSAKVVRVLKHNTTHFVGTFRVRKTVQFFPDSERIKSKITVKNIREVKVRDGLKANCKIVRYGNPMLVEVTEVLGHKKDKGVDVLSVLMEYGIVNEFDKAVMKQVAKIDDHVTEAQRKGRQDLRHQTVVTIDGDDAKDFDDAIAIEKENDKYRLYVHIADVSSYVPVYSPLDLEARARGTSTYVTDRVVPMLPEALSNGICSLNPHVDRCTLTCEMLVNRQGEIDDYAIYPSVICSTERMTYNHVNKILDGDERLIQHYAHLGNLFMIMKECADVIRRRREQNGAIDFEKKEAKIMVDEFGKAIDIVPRERGSSEMMIEDFMVLANECVARHMKYLEIPALYRVHENPKEDKLHTFISLVKRLGYQFKGDGQDIKPLQLRECLNYFKDRDEYPIISTLMLRCMAKARYDRNPLGHFGLSLEDYCHFTSPIRRYPDLIVHRMLRKYYFHENLDMVERSQDELLLDSLADETSSAERNATEAEREVTDMKKAEYMEDKIGQIFDGIVSGVTKFGMFVELPNTVEGLVRLQTMKDDYYIYDEANNSLIGELTGKVYTLGQKVTVKCTDANKYRKEVDFELLKPRRKHRQVWR